MSKKIVQRVLKIFSRLIVKKYRPEIVAITGSVGKTSTKEAVRAVLASKFSVRANLKNYNNEIGVPLSIIGAVSAGKSLLGWLMVFFQAIVLILIRNKNYPKILVLEIGADKIGDIEYFASFLPFKIGIITAISPVHLEKFGSIERIAREKRLLISRLDKDDYAVLNHDDELVSLMGEKTKAKIFTYGFQEGSDISASEAKISYEESGNIQGMSFKLSHQGNIAPILLPEVLGSHQLYAALAAVAVGLIYEMNLLEIAEALKNYHSPNGRMRLLGGIKDTMIIDDTYNSSPQAALAAVEALASLRSGRKKIAVLSDMLELGDFADQAHLDLGRAVAKNHLDTLITVGPLAQKIAAGAEEAGLSREQIFSFNDNLTAGKFLQDQIAPGDIILIKGSQGTRMEEVVKEIMAEPLRAEELLVRQGAEWQKSI